MSKNLEIDSSICKFGLDHYRVKGLFEALSLSFLPLYLSLTVPSLN